MVLSDHVVPAAYGIGPEFLFVQDNTMSHTAAIYMEFFREHEICTMD